MRLPLAIIIAACMLLVACQSAPAVPVAPPPDGTFLTDGTTVYVMQGGLRRGFGDPETYHAWGAPPDGSGVVVLTPAQIQTIPEGAPIPRGSRRP